MDRKLQLETLAFVLLIVAFPVISQGASHGHTWLWVLGLVAVVAGGLLPVVTRYLNHDADEPRDVGMEYDDRPS